MAINICRIVAERRMPTGPEARLAKREHTPGREGLGYEIAREWMISAGRTPSAECGIYLGLVGLGLEAVVVAPRLCRRSRAWPASSDLG